MYKINLVNQIEIDNTPIIEFEIFIKKEKEYKKVVYLNDLKVGHEIKLLVNIKNYVINKIMWCCWGIFCDDKNPKNKYNKIINNKDDLELEYKITEQDIDNSKNGNCYLYFLIKDIDFVSAIKLNFKK